VKQMNEKLQKDPVVQFVMKYRSRLTVGALLLAVLILALSVRMNTFWLPHWMGDQCHYVSLAMKIDKLGFDNYNLRKVDGKSINVTPDGKIQLIYPSLTDNPKSKGMILEGLEAYGIRYYDQPFFHKPPALSYMIMWSHKLFAPDKDKYTIVLTNIGKYLNKVKPAIFFKAQFYAAVVPLFFSIGLSLAAFAIGRLLFSSRVGIYAAFLMAIHPVSIMTSQKIWADDMLSFFVSLSFIALILSVKYKKDWLVALAGALCGIGVLTKQSAGYLVFGVFVFFFLTHKNSITGVISAVKAFFNRRSIIFTAFVLLVSGFWFYKIYTIYGNPLFLPTQPGIVDMDKTGWFKQMRSRPVGGILFLVQIPYLCPAFLFAYFTISQFIRETVKAVLRQAYDYRLVFLWVFVLTFYWNVRFEQEERLMLPVYPLLAVLAASAIERFRRDPGRFSKYFGNIYVREAIIIIFLIGCAIWAVPIGINTGIEQKILLRIPF